MSDAAPLVSKYRLTVTIRGDTREEIEDALLTMTRGGYLADAFAHMPHWVAVRETLLAQLDVLVARAGLHMDDSLGFVSSVVREMDEARDERDRAVAASTADNHADDDQGGAEA